MKKTILIVDDSSTNLYMLKCILEGEGFEAILAENGKEALDKARLNPPDLIVSDILMPVMDGYTLCRQWKSDDRLKHIPFIFYTATYTEPKDEAFALSLGADRFILKPQEPEMIIGVLQEVIHDNHGVKHPLIKPLGEEMEFFRRHNEILFKKLEKKMLDLEVVNQKLRISEECYRLSFRNVSDVIYTMDKNLNIISMSPSVEKILGYKPKDFIGRPASDLRHILMPESFEQAKADMHLILNGETIPVEVYRFIAKDGVIIYGEVSVSAVTRDSEIVGVVSVARDITDRKRAEDELRHSEEKYRLLFDNAGEAIFIVQEGILKFFNLAAITTSGYPVESLLLKPFTQFIHPEDREKVYEFYKKRIRGEDVPSNYAFRIKTQDGSFKWVAIHSTLVDWEGKAATLNFLSDITEQKRAEGKLRKSEARFRSYFELPLVGIAVTSPEKGWIEGNNRLSTILGYSWQELKEKTWSEMTYPEDLAADTEQFDRVLAGEIDSYMIDKRFIRKNGEVIWTSLAAGCVRKRNGKVDYFVVLLDDITERKESVAKLRKSLSATVNAIAVTVEARDPYTAGHQRRTTDLARTIATEMNLSDNQIDGIRTAAMIHDIGKISIPVEILSMPRKLTDIEFDLIKTHPEAGYEILKDIDFPWPIARMVLEHHERMNGSGYPKGLTGDKLLIESRILMVADVVEAMASHRPYRPAIGIDAALDEISKNKGIIYDPDVVDACIGLFRDKGYKFKAS